MYLIAYYYMRPKHQRVRTNVSGWIKDKDNVTWDEQIALSTKLKDRDISSAKVILNLTEKKVFMNSWTGDRDFDSLFDHYYKHYKKDLHPVVEQLGYFTDPITEIVTEEIRVVETPGTLIKQNETISTQ